MSLKNIITFLFFMANVILMMCLQNREQNQEDDINRFKLDYGTPEMICPRLNYTCDDGVGHFICSVTQRMNPKCICFIPIQMPRNTIKLFVQGTNGIRNKVAMDYNIANMNLVYWSDDLMYMAAQYVLECRLELDPCRIIGEKNLKLSQNRVLLKNELTERWPGRVVRHWFLEIGAGSDWESVENRIYKGELSNFSNMAYPLTEFMGCAGARLKEGFFIVCYFYPAFSMHTFEADFEIGPACSSCIYARPTCSRTFVGLCGVDYEVDMSKAFKPSIYFTEIFVICCICFALVYFFIV